MRNNLIKTVLIGGFFSFSIAQSAPITSIEITGLNAISRGTVLNYLPVEVGDDYNQQTSAQIIQTLYQTRFFKDIEVSQNNQILQINILENPSIKYINLLNYSSKVIEKEALDKILQSMGLVQGKIFNKRKLNELISQLKSNYIAKGYYNTKITEKIEIDTKNRVDIEVDIDEGEVARITLMNINGSVAYSEKKLLKLFKIGEPDFFLLNYFTQKDHYSKPALDAGIEALKSRYLNSAYLDVKIEHSTELSDDKQNIIIEINVNEGKQYTLGKVHFSGNLLDQSVEDLEALLPIKAGDIFERKKIIQTSKKISNVFTDKGYAFSSVDAVPTTNINTHTVDVNINIELNQRVYINRITITGNTRTQDDVIRREINIAEGGLYSNTDLNKSIAKIKRLGYFSDVKMEVSKVSGFKDKINLHFSVVETKTGQFTIGFSQSSKSGVSFNLGIKERNFLGTGNTLNATLSNSKAVKEVAFYFSDPYFTEDGHSISYGVFSKSTDGSELSSGEYNIDQTGVLVGYGIPISETTRISTELRISQRDLTCGNKFLGTDGADTTKPGDTIGDFKGTYTTTIEPFPEGVGPQEVERTRTDSDGNTQKITVNNQDYSGVGFEAEQCASNDKHEVKVNVNWSNNTLNNFSFPTDGEKNQLSLDITLPIGDFRYYKLSASHKSYRALNDNVTLALKSKIGIGGGYAGKPLPFFERYSGGGASSVRGFDFNSLGDKYDTYDNSNVAKGGELSLLTSAAIISKLGFVDDSKNMRVSAFIDAGSISEKSFDEDDARVSAGAAFTWLTPIGPLGFYLAKPLISKPDDDVKTFNFSIGNTF